MSGFDVKGALKEGYTRKEIVDHLAKQNGYDAEAARAEGYTDDAILRHLVGAPQVVEDKESPAMLSMIGGGLGAAYGVGDTGIRVAHGSFTKRIEDAAEKSAKKLAETFADDMASRRAANPLVPASGSGDAVTNWTKQMHSGAHHGGRDFSEAHEIASKLKAAEKADPRFRAVQGSPILLDTRTADQVNAARGAAPVVPPKAPPTRTPILQNPAVKIPFRAASLTGQLTAPAAGMASSGYGAAQAINRLQEGTSPRDKVAGAVNVLGAASGLGSLAHNPKIKYPATAVSGALNWLAKLIATDKNEFEEPEQKAAGGAIQGYANKGKVELIGRGVESGLDLAKKLFTPKPTKIVKASEAIGPHEGKYLGLTQTDNFGVHEGRMGGNQFPNFQNISPLHARDRVVWMNDSEKHANDLVKNRRMNDRDVIFSTYLGAQDQLKSNKTVANDILNNFYSKNWTPEQIDAINRNIATRVKGKDKGLVFPQPFDIRDKFAVQELGMDTFDRRGALAELLGKGSGLQGRKAGFGLKNYEDILESHRDPLTKGVPTSSVGTRLFSVDETPARFSTEYHPDYNWAVQGQDMGVQFNPVPQNLIVPDWYKRTEAKSPGKNRTHGNAWFSYMKEPQLITHDYLMGLEKAGYKAGGLAHMSVGGDVFKNTVKAYKLFRTDPKREGELFPLFVEANTPVPMKQWLPATDSYHFLAANGRPYVPNGRTGSVIEIPNDDVRRELLERGLIKDPKTKSIKSVAYRPGWHAGDSPMSTHLGGMSGLQKGVVDYRKPTEVWAEVEMPNDVDWQSVANARMQFNKKGEPLVGTAQITDQVPRGGFYRYKTNPNMTGQWMIGGDMRVNRVLSDEEVRAINEMTGQYDLPRYSPLSESYLQAMKKASGKAEGGLAHMAGGGQAYKMFQQLYRGYAGKPGAEEIFASPQKRVAEYYAQKRAAQTGLQPGVEAVQVDPFAGKQYGHALPIDQFNQDVVTTQARKLSPLDVLNPAPNKMTEAELGMAEYFDNMRKAAQAQRARSAEALKQRAQHYANLQGPQPRSDMGRSVAELAESMEARYK